MVLLKKVVAWGLVLVLFSALFGCATHPKAEKWQLPKKESADSALIIGRLDLPSNKKENPDGDVLYLETVDFLQQGKWYPWHVGEDSVVMDNSYFVIPNIKPGKYFFFGFTTLHGASLVAEESSLQEKDFLKIGPGEIRFVGSFDYVKNERSLFEKIKNSGTFNLRTAAHPTELEMLQWLDRISAGSGWESAIRKRIKELGGRS